MKILMLGNSFIFTNNLPQLLARLIGAEVEDHSAGGAELKDHVNPEHELGAKNIEALEREHWDYVIIQECSNGPVTDKEEFLKNVEILCRMCRKNKAVPVLYATWAYKKGSAHMQNFTKSTAEKARLSKVSEGKWAGLSQEDAQAAAAGTEGIDYDTMYQMLYDAYHEAADENMTLVADVGKRFYKIAEEAEGESCGDALEKEIRALTAGGRNRTPDLYAEDGCHPSEYGTRIAAEVIAEVIEGRHTVTASEMKMIEAAANAEGLSYYQMMENAGTAAYKIIKENYPDLEQLIIFGGKGNNGGDGYVVARLASAEGIKVNVITCDGVPVTEDAKTNFDLLAGCRGVEIMTFETLERNLMSYNGAYCDIFSDRTVIVDAIYGSGFHGEFRSDIVRQACGIINESSCPVISLDLPSGMNADTGEIARGVVRADMTIAFHFKKNAHIKINALEVCGKTVVADIGIQ